LKMIPGGSPLDSQEVARFRTEAEAVARLRHPNLCKSTKWARKTAGLSLPWN
jgi:hypothetical protein